MNITRPRRVTHSYVQTIEGSTADIMPLYCPVLEAKWCEGWNPVVVYSESGVVEPDCVFITRDGENESAMQSWEKAMNHYLKTGKMLTGLSGF